jgi:hypothetical protein
LAGIRETELSPEDKKERHLDRSPNALKEGRNEELAGESNCLGQNILDGDIADMFEDIINLGIREVMFIPEILSEHWVNSLGWEAQFNCSALQPHLTTKFFDCLPCKSDIDSFVGSHNNLLWFYLSLYEQPAPDNEI